MTLAIAGPPPELLSSHPQADHAPLSLLRLASPPHAGVLMFRACGVDLGALLRVRLSACSLECAC